MRKALYNTCVVDPWGKVAQKLLVEQEIYPVYWIGYSYDKSARIIPNLFPDVQYQSTENAWKGIFPDALDEAYHHSYVDVDFLKKYGNNEVQSFYMMNRIDFDAGSFNFQERERLFLRLIKYWTACREVYKFDVVISAVNPHRIYDYVLYLLCKEWKIPFLIFQYSMVADRIYALPDFYSIGDFLDKDYENFLSIQSLKWDSLDKDIISSYQKIISDYSVAEPEYMLINKSNNKRYQKLSSWIKTYIIRNKEYSRKDFFKNTESCFKKKRVALEDTSRTIWEYYPLLLNKTKYLKELKSHYDTLVSQANSSEKYIYFPLHYQPEATTSPGGDIYVNQSLCVEMLLKNSSDDTFIYVREHPSQYMAQFLGQTSRIKEFYTDLANNPRVKLISIADNPYFLMQNAVAVATVTGTVGWEAICNKKPVIIFGVIWYEKCPGVLRITDELSAKNMMAHIEKFIYSEHKVLAYLSAFEKNSIRAYHYDGYRELSNVSQEESAINISSKIVELLVKNDEVVE